jgi:hypothetical protein
MAPEGMPPEALPHWLEMRASFEAGAWRVLPVYPHGLVIVQDHWPATAVVPVCALAVVAAGLHRLLRRLGIAAGRAVVAADVAATVDWDRFGDIAYFTCCHLLMTAFFVVFLGHEGASWLTGWHQLWDFYQPPLSDALWWYYIIQLALTTESCLHMLHGLVGNGGRDLPMLIHHWATMCDHRTQLPHAAAATSIPIRASRAGVCGAKGAGGTRTHPPAGSPADANPALSAPLGW